MDRSERKAMIAAKINALTRLYRQAAAGKITWTQFRRQTGQLWRKDRTARRDVILCALKVS